MKILIVKLSAIGDVIHTLPALNAIRASYPDAHITWLVEAAAADLVVGHRALDRVIVSEPQTLDTQLKTGRSTAGDGGDTSVSGATCATRTTTSSSIFSPC